MDCKMEEVGNVEGNFSVSSFGSWYAKHVNPSMFAAEC